MEGKVLIGEEDLRRKRPVPDGPRKPREHLPERAGRVQRHDGCRGSCLTHDPHRRLRVFRAYLHRRTSGREPGQGGPGSFKFLTVEPGRLIGTSL